MSFWQLAALALMGSLVATVVIVGAGVLEAWRRKREDERGPGAGREGPLVRLPKLPKDKGVWRLR